MATIAGTYTAVDIPYWKMEWVGLTEADEGNSFAIPDNTGSMFLQAVGDFAGGMEIQFRGSYDDGVNWVIMPDANNDPIELTSDKVHTLITRDAIVKPVAISGLAASVTVTIYGRSGT